MDTRTLILSCQDKERLRVIAQRLGINTDISERYECRPKNENALYSDSKAVFVGGTDTWFVELMEHFFRAIYSA